MLSPAPLRLIRAMSDLPLLHSLHLPPAQPSRQVEVQLGHLCNNRCVFCVSGQLSEQRRAPQLGLQPILAQLAQARAEGAQRITLLGGEPTIQRGFLEVLQFAVDQGFPEIVVFTNGVMTPRETFRDRVFTVLDGLGEQAQARVIWRFSLQGGDQQAHDATTLTPGSWERIVQSLAILQARGARLTGNMCVVTSNYQSVPHLAAVAAQFGLENLHLDMVRPRDSGDRTDAELQAMLARYTDMAPALLQLSQQADVLLGPNWDLNFGNVPYCTNLAVAHRIHHDGQDTVTVAADGQGNTQQGFNKYEDKRVDKHKPLGCTGCVFFDSCSGVFDKYRQFYGDAEFVAVTAAQLWASDTAGHHFVRLAKLPLAALQAQGVLQLGSSDERLGEIEVASGPVTLRLRRAGRATTRPGWHTLVAGRLQAEVVAAPAPTPQAEAHLLQLWASVVAALDASPEVGEPLPQLRLAWRGQWQAHLARKTVAQVVDPLRKREIAGFALLSTETGRDGATLMQWRCGDYALQLRVRAERDARGGWRPALDHHASGVPDAAVQQFNRELGAVLRGK